MMRAESLYMQMYPAGGKIPLAQVPFWMHRAVCELDRLTLGRFSQVEDNYPMCVCDMADCLYQEEASGVTIKSENIDGYSVTYGDAEAPEVRHMKIAKRYLSGTGMLYQGVM